MTTCPVNSYNEWDPLEEVIVGQVKGASMPPGHVSVLSAIPEKSALWYKLIGGHRHPRILINWAQKELDEFIHILKGEGITVKQPDIMDFSAPFRTPYWKSRGFCTASPRDSLLVVGDEIIECPMAWRSRYFESHAYRSLLKEYFKNGARWTSAPKPQLNDALYDYNYRVPQKNMPVQYVINEYEPVFDAADFVRCGKDLFVIRSNVTNQFGIAWLKRHLGEKYTIHEIETTDRQPMHIDCTFMPLCPGKALINPERIIIDKLPDILRKWDVRVAPTPDPAESFILRFPAMCSCWTNMNVLMLDEKRVIVEKSQKSMIKALKEWDFEPIPCSFMNYSLFGGSFHCATLDIRRRGELQSYF